MTTEPEQVMINIETGNTEIGQEREHLVIGDGPENFDQSGDVNKM